MISKETDMNISAGAHQAPIKDQFTQVFHFESLAQLRDFRARL